MLSVTCDAFVHTLDECVKLATGDSSQSLLLLSPSPTTTVDETTLIRKSFSELDQSKFVNRSFYILFFLLIIFSRSVNSTITTSLPKQIVYKTFFSQLPYT